MKKPNKPFDQTPTRVWRDSHGSFHRSNGPAIEWDNGNKEWWTNGECRKLDGGPTFHFLNGVTRWDVAKP